LTTAHVLAALSQTVPLAKTMAEKITAQRNWANGRARNASIARTIEGNGEVQGALQPRTTAIQMVKIDESLNR
jgi:hypothetical protein